MIPVRQSGDVNSSRYFTVRFIPMKLRVTEIDFSFLVLVLFAAKLHNF